MFLACYGREEEVAVLQDTKEAGCSEAYSVAVLRGEALGALIQVYRSVCCRA
jgi:hypothetical protein